MDKGIRPAAIAAFAAELPTLATVGNTQFRKNVMFTIMEDFGITLASAATHYNHAFKKVKKATPELVAGLGRPEDKKGGRKRKAVVIAKAVATLLSTGIKENTSTQTVTVNPDSDANDAGEAAPAQVEFNVLKKSTGEVVATGVCFEDAVAMVAKAKAAKKAALYYV